MGMSASVKAEGSRTAVSTSIAGPVSDESGPGRTVLQVRAFHVTLRRGRREVQALQGVDLDIARGEILALVGESGSGKSTLSLAIQGLLSTEAQATVTGSICVDGVELVGAPAATLRELRRHRFRPIFQDPMTSLNPTMRVERQMREASEDDQSPEWWLSRVGINDAHRRRRAFPHELSGGQRQRVMIAMAMSGRPSLVLADEPTTALDVTVQAQILELIRHLREGGDTGFLFVTHDLAVAASIADRIVVLYAGRVVETGTVRDVIDRPAHPYTAALLEARFGLDANKSKQLPTLPGDPQTSTVAGCAFAPRCLLAIDACRSEQPRLQSVAQHQGLAACIRSALVTPQIWATIAKEWPRSEGRPSEALLRIRGASKVYDLRGRRRGEHVSALQGVDLDVAVGEAVALVGESGSGKSTLLRIAAGLIKPTSGEVAYSGQGRPQMGFQDAAASLTPWMTLGELVGERLGPLSLSRLEARERVSAALERVGLRASVAQLLPSQLSGGQQQRAAIARATIVP